MKKKLTPPKAYCIRKINIPAYIHGCQNQIPSSQYPYLLPPNCSSFWTQILQLNTLHVTYWCNFYVGGRPVTSIHFIFSHLFWNVYEHFLNSLISFSFTYRWLMSILVEIGSLFIYISLQKYMYWMMKGQTDGQEGSQTKIHENNPNTHSYSSLLLTSLSILTAARLGYWALVRADRGWLTSSELPISVTTTEINYWQFSIHICSQKQKLNKHIFNLNVLTSSNNHQNRYYSHFSTMVPF